MDKPVMKKHNLTKVLNSKQKLALLVIIVSVMVFGVSLYLLTSKVDNDAQQSLAANRAEITQLTTVTNAKLADKAISNTDKITLVKNYGTDSNLVADKLCAQQQGRFYSSLISTLKRCQRAESWLRQAVATTNSMYMYMKDEATLAAVIPKQLEDLTIVQSYEVWNKATDTLNTTGVSDKLTDQKSKLKKAMTDYRDAWKQLKDADFRNDETAFIAAQDLLEKTHQALLGCAQNIADPLKEISTNLTTQLNGFFEESKDL